MQGNSVVGKADLDEIWEGLKKGQSITLWCDALPVEENSSCNRPVSVDEAKSSKDKRKMSGRD